VKFENIREKKDNNSEDFLYISDNNYSGTMEKHKKLGHRPLEL